MVQAGDVERMTMDRATATPLDHALETDAKHRIIADAWSTEQLERTWRLLGLRPFVDSSSKDYAAITFSALDPTSSPRAQDVVGAWLEYLDRDQATLADLLLIEYWFSIGVVQAGAHLPSRMTLSKTLLTVRQRLALKLHDYARQVNWRRPVLFVSVLKMARAYLRDAVGHEDAIREEHRKEFTGRLGVTTVLISRFEKVSKSEAQEAALALTRSIKQGNTNEEGLAYFLESACVYFDANGDRDILESAVALAGSVFRLEGGSSVSLAYLDVLFRLATDSSTDSALTYLRLAQQVQQNCHPDSAEDRVRLVMASAIIEHLLQAATIDGLRATVHARLPFGLRVQGELNDLLLCIADRVVPKLRALTTRQEPLAQGLLADYLLFAGDRLGLSRQQALMEVVHLRGADSLADERSRLLYCRDRLELAAATDDKYLRIKATTDLARMAAGDVWSPAPLVLLARDIDEHGRHSVPVPSGTPEKMMEIFAAIRVGDREAFMYWAAEGALDSPDLTTLNLGGRSGITLVGDYYGLTGETLLFKKTSRTSYEDERSRAATLASDLRKSGTEDEFSISVPFAAFDTGDSKTVTIVRPYVSGQSLYRELNGSGVSRRIELLDRTARFLALAHASQRNESPSNARRAIKSGELGRWLKKCGLTDPNETFDRWWDIAGSVELVRRRDAHAHNWLVTSDDQIVAIDWETSTWRPRGYDLAQLTDDHAFLDMGDWQGRRRVFDAYMSAYDPSSTVDHSIEQGSWHAYEAHVLARIVGALTGSGTDTFPAAVAEIRLKQFGESVSDKRLQDLAQEILSGWLTRRGLSSIPEDGAGPQGAGRIRASKSIAYHLRHDLNLAADSAGWVDLVDLQHVLPFRLSIEGIAALATAQAEPRFEIAGGRIRARYGHSRSVQLDVPPASIVKPLYHASPWMHAGKILDAGEGIRPMTRRWVHLTDSFEEAVANGVRRGHPIIYSMDPSHIKFLVQAQGHTFLADEVPHRALRVVPISCIWDLVPVARMEA